MPVSEPTDRTPGPVRLEGENTRQALLAEVYRSKRRMAQLESETQGHQTRGATAQAVLRARRETMEALENYSAALRLRGWPTPPKMLREIQLLRSLMGIRRPGLDT